MEPRFQFIRLPKWMLHRWLTMKISDQIRDGKAWLVESDLPEDVQIVGVFTEPLTDSVCLKLYHPSFPVVADGNTLMALGITFRQEAYELEVKPDMELANVRPEQRHE
jgi:hypothetical protein